MGGNQKLTKFKLISAQVPGLGDSPDCDLGVLVFVHCPQMSMAFEAT